MTRRFSYNQPCVNEKKSILRFFVYIVLEAAQELFWWSVFNKRIKLSTFLWKRTHNKLANALIAVALCKLCQKQIPISETFHNMQFVEMQNLYESYSLNLLDEGNSLQYYSNKLQY